MSITETDYCPLTGDTPNPHGRKVKHISGCNHILIPYRVLPPGTTDAEAEHMAACSLACEWSRESDGRVILWVLR